MYLFFISNLTFKKCIIQHLFLQRKKYLCLRLTIKNVEIEKEKKERNQDLYHIFYLYTYILIIFNDMLGLA